jgi:hypothetical protein
MSARELAWRAAAPVRARLWRTPLRRPDWDTPGWTELLERLAGTAAPATTAAAARIAGGELCFWGRAARIDPLRPDWNVEPVDGDPKRIWELHRQQHLVPLALGSAIAERPDWARVCVDQLVSWVASSPPGRGPAWSSGYEASHRLIGWAWAVPLVAPEASAQELALLADSYALQRQFVERSPSRFSSANNHRIAELVGLLGASMLSGGVGWQDTWRELEDEVVLQTYPDGGSREQASGYFLYVLELLWLAGLFAQASGQSLGRLEERLEAMLTWLFETTGPDGEPPSFGDDAEDRGLSVDYFTPRSAASIAGRAQSLLGGSPSLSHTVTEHTERSCLLESGYAVLRASLAGSAVRVVFDVGDLGFGSLAAHGHADALSVTLAVDAVTLLRDSGTGSYVVKQGRNEFRTTAAHNTVVVDGRPQAEALGPHLWGRRPTTTVETSTLGRELDYVRASHDGYGRARHVRSVLFLKPDVLVVFDRVWSARPFEAELSWHLCPGETLQSFGGGRAQLIVAAVPAPQFERGVAPFSPRYTQHESAPRYRWRSRGSDVVFATVVTLDGSTAPACRLEVGTDGTAVLHLLAPRSLIVIETWSAAAADVSPARVN